MAGEIIVPLDGSALAENAIPAAAWLQRLYGAPVVFVHSAEHPAKRPEAEAHSRDVFIAYARETATRHGLAESGFSAELLEGGSAAAAVLNRASGAAFIVLGTHGRGGFRATFLGSVADKIVRGAEAPVLAVPGTGPAPAFDVRRVLVALDGSKEAEIALEKARDIAGRVGAEVLLARAYQVVIPVGVEFAYYTGEVTEGLEAEAVAYLRSVARTGERQLLLSGAAADAVVGAAREEDAGLVVMASQGKGLAGRIALGSTTDRVLHSLERPLLIVKA